MQNNKLNKYYLMSIMFFFHTGVLAQSTQEDNFILGDWSGVLNVQGMKLRLVFKIAKDASGVYQATLDSPDQSAADIPVSKVTIKSDKIKFEVSAAQASFIGKLTNGKNELIGNWIQASHKFPLTLTKNTTLKKQIRPQEPIKPYPYKSKEVTFYNNQAGINLAGTLTYPQGESQIPAVILISGSGPQNRNGAIMGHRPFLVIADYLTRHGIAVLRYDDRGVGESEGVFSEATSIDFSTDVIAAKEYLQRQEFIDENKIGLIGHSEGGMIAPMVSVNSSAIAFMVLMAGPGLNGQKIYLTQTAKLLESIGLTENAINAAIGINEKLIELVVEDDTTSRSLKKVYEGIWANLDDNVKQELTNNGLYGLPDEQLQTITSPWFLYFIRHNPKEWLEKITIPTLAINGEKDLQVDADTNLAGIKQAFAHVANKDIRIKKFNGLNHLFQTAQTGSINEYATIEETISPEVLELITGWILEKAEGFKAGNN